MNDSNQIAPVAPKKSFGLILFLLIIVLVVVAAIAGLIFAGMARAAFSKPSAVAIPSTVVVNPGETWPELSSRLAGQSEVPSAYWMRLYIRLHPEYAKLSAGSYILPAHSNIRQIALQLQTVAIKQNTLLITEGQTVNDIAADIAANLTVHISKAQVIAAQKQLAASYSFLDSSGATHASSLEGYLFPDTYDVDTSDTATSILQRMLDNENQKITLAMRDAVKSNNMTIVQTVTIASLIEKEIGTTGTTVRNPQVVQQERETVAGIIENRLKLGMPLQLDSTKNYIQPGVSQPDPAYDTYAHAGLPPGPICNPSLNSIEAVVNPISSNYLYFITDKTGTAHFATTIQEQDANIAEYLK